MARACKRTTASGDGRSLPRIADFVDRRTLSTLPAPAILPAGAKSSCATRPMHLREAGCARQILRQARRHAYRRPVTDADYDRCWPFTNRPAQRRIRVRHSEGGRGDPGFSGFSVPRRIGYVDARRYRPSSLEAWNLASRLSFFLWSSVPDDELLDLARDGQAFESGSAQAAGRADAGRSQVRRAGYAISPDSGCIFATWRPCSPDPVVFAEFDESLRCEHAAGNRVVFREHRARRTAACWICCTANYTFLNERLAKHYGIPDIYGSQFRRVALQDPNRGGLLGQASLLTVTSPPNRTSVVQRGKWVLENLLGAPPPPPPPDMPPLEETTKGQPESEPARGDGDASRQSGLRRLPRA